jgi:GMP synthase (glutamine-hydrolysing)
MVAFTAGIKGLASLDRERPVAADGTFGWPPGREKDELGGAARLSGSRSAVAIRHVHFEDLGAFEVELRAAGYRVSYIEAGIDDLDAIDSDATDLLAVLGGPIGAYEEDRYPFLKPELRLIERRLRAGRPTLGLCLGAQLMARALGAKVRPGPAKEIGWAPLELTEEGRAGPLRHLGAEPVLHWHGDILDLPDGAARLASTRLCPNQAFALDRTALGVQFHPEAEAAGFERWLIGHAAEIAAVGLSPALLRRETAQFAPAAAERGRRLISEWLSGLAG